MTYTHESKNSPTSPEASEGNCAAVVPRGVAGSGAQGERHSGHRFLFALDQLGPNGLPVVAKLLASYCAFAVTLNQHGKPRSAWLQSVHDVLEVPLRGQALGGELVALLACLRGEKSFQVHERYYTIWCHYLSTPFGVVRLIYLRHE